MTIRSKDNIARISPIGNKKPDMFSHIGFKHLMGGFPLVLYLHATSPERRRYTARKQYTTIPQRGQ